MQSIQNKLKKGESEIKKQEKKKTSPPLIPSSCHSPTLMAMKSKNLKAPGCVWTSHEAWNRHLLEAARRTEEGTEWEARGKFADESLRVKRARRGRSVSLRCETNKKKQPKKKNNRTSVPSRSCKLRLRYKPEPHSAVLQFLHAVSVCRVKADVLERRDVTKSIRHCRLFCLRNPHLSSSPASTPDANSPCVLVGTNTEKLIKMCLFSFPHTNNSLFCCLFGILTSGLLFWQEQGPERHFRVWMSLQFPGSSVVSPTKKFKKRSAG